MSALFKDSKEILKENLKENCATMTPKSSVIAWI